MLVEARAYFHKQRSLNMLSYLQALVTLEVKSMKSSMLYTNIVTFMDCIDCFWFILKKWYMLICFYFKYYIFISKKDSDCRIFELQLLNLAALHFETYWKSFEHGLSIEKHFDCMCEYSK